MVKITLFSTKTINERGCLFDDNALLINDDRLRILLHDYFLKPRDMIHMIRKNEEKWKKLNILILSKLENIVDNIQEYATNKDLEESENENQEITMDFLEDRIMFEYHDPDAIDSILERIEKWSLVNYLHELTPYQDIPEDVRDKSQMYQLPNSDVYAIKCLEDNDMDISGTKWIPCLIKCAKLLANDSPVDINLVMHDKDLGNNTYYTLNDMTLLDDDMVRLQFDIDTTNPLLNPDDRCRITFFKHTTNFITNILNTPFSQNRDIHQETIDGFKENYDEYGVKKKDVIYNFERLCNIKDKSKECLNDENGIETAKQLNDDLKTIINTL